MLPEIFQKFMMYFFILLLALIGLFVFITISISIFTYFNRRYRSGNIFEGFENNENNLDYNNDLSKKVGNLLNKKGCLANNKNDEIKIDKYNNVLNNVEDTLILKSHYNI